mmetsp:Transcript_17954/g.29966  ORF Transcript_17954/g.29966 Transcript_17954/m.29966 type:complete len:201 (-) Transcript_17954:266-868(-)
MGEYAFNQPVARKSISYLQVGQVCERPNQRSMQSAWKMCIHGKTRTRSVATKSAKQTLHSALVSLPHFLHSLSASTNPTASENSISGRTREMSSAEIAATALPPSPPTPLFKSLCVSARERAIACAICSSSKACAVTTASIRSSRKSRLVNASTMRSREWAATVAAASAISEGLEVDIRRQRSTDERLSSSLSSPLLREC